MTEKILYEAYSFDDLLLVPRESSILPSDASLSTRLTRDLQINVPLLSAAMDRVTEAKTSIAMAQLGGMGVIHRNLGVERQAELVEVVKRSESGMITEPVVIDPDDSIRHALALMEKFKISGLPVVKAKKLVGILTNRDLRFAVNLEQPISNLMTKGRENLVTVDKSIDLTEAKQLMHRHRIEKLLRINENYELIGLITIKDIDKARKFPNSSKDSSGRLLVGAAIGTGDAGLERAEALIEKKVDALVIDTSHGHSKNVIEMLRHLKAKHPDTQVIAGNFATAEGALAAVENGADAVKIGIGPGSICTTRIISGVGIPQMSAIFNVAEACRKRNVPCIADGGIKYSGEITKALAAGAESVMIGNLLAGSEESPGEVILYQGRRYKQYRGMGSIGAMKQGSKDRYKQELAGDGDLIPEGIEGRVGYKGPIADIVHQLTGGIRAGMGYLGCQTIPELYEHSRFVKISGASLRESHVHEVYITEEAPNYQA